MKAILKWVLLVVTILIVGFSMYAIISIAGLQREPWIHPDIMPIVMVLFAAISGGSIFLCVGAFKRSKTLAIIGVVIFACVVVFAIITYRIGSAYYESYFNG